LTEPHDAPRPRGGSPLGNAEPSRKFLPVAFSRQRVLGWVNPGPSRAG
jgi:hypothetical protein